MLKVVIAVIASLFFIANAYSKEFSIRQQVMQYFSKIKQEQQSKATMQVGKTYIFITPDGHIVQEAPNGSYVPLKIKHPIKNVNGVYTNDNFELPKPVRVISKPKASKPKFWEKQNIVLDIHIGTHFYRMPVAGKCTSMDVNWILVVMQTVYRVGIWVMNNFWGVTIKDTDSRDYYSAYVQTLIYAELYRVFPHVAIEKVAKATYQAATMMRYLTLYFWNLKPLARKIAYGTNCTPEMVMYQFADAFTLFSYNNLCKTHIPTVKIDRSAVTFIFPPGMLNDIRRWCKYDEAKEWQGLDYKHLTEYELNDKGGYYEVPEGLK